MSQEEEKTEEFNPTSFLGTETSMENSSPQPETKESEDTEDTEESPAAEVEESESDDGEASEEDGEGSEGDDDEGAEASTDSDWDTVGAVENEKVEDDESEESEDAPEDDSPKDKSEAWKTIAEDLGMEVSSADELKQRLLHQQKLAKKGLSNEKVDTWKGLKALEDEVLVRKELEAKKMSEEEIEDEIDVMIENRTLKGKARDIRRDLDAVIDQEIESLSKQLEPEDSMSDEDAAEASRELKEYLSKTGEFFGGRVNEKQKDDHFKYIESGSFFDEVTETAESIAKAAWLWRYRDQIFSGKLTAGTEKGKAAILDNMVNPEVGKSSHIPEQKGDFSSAKFLDTEQM